MLDIRNLLQDELKLKGNSNILLDELAAQKL
jgi:hypothetical protein